jgi:hypothetical protein
LIVIVLLYRSLYNSLFSIDSLISTACLILEAIRSSTSVLVIHLITSNRAPLSLKFILKWDE